MRQDIQDWNNPTCIELFNVIVAWIAPKKGLSGVKDPFLLF